MTDINTPLAKLDEAIQEFLGETGQLNEGTFVTAWAIGVSTARIQSEDDQSLPLLTSLTYVFGPQTSLAQLAGLAKYLDVVAEQAMYRTLEPDSGD